MRRPVLFPGKFDIELRRFAHTEVYGGVWHDGLLIELPVVRVRRWTIAERLDYYWRCLLCHLGRGDWPSDCSHRAAHVDISWHVPLDGPDPYEEPLWLL